MIWCLLLLLLVVAFVVFGNRWKFHFIVVALMYIAYLYLWINFFLSHNTPYQGYGILVFILYGAPFYAIYHLSVIAYAKVVVKDKNIVQVNIVGLVLLTIQLVIAIIGLFF